MQEYWKSLFHRKAYYREAGKYYNRCYFVKPDGATAYYDKRHLFTYGGEDRHFTRGNRRTVVPSKTANPRNSESYTDLVSDCHC